MTFGQKKKIIDKLCIIHLIVPFIGLLLGIIFLKDNVMIGVFIAMVINMIIFLVVYFIWFHVKESSFE